MKNYKLLTFFVGLLLVGSLSAQDDLYYNPAKDKVVFDDYKSSNKMTNKTNSNDSYNSREDNNYDEEEYAYEEDYDYYYSSRIRRFQRPYYGFNFYDPVYVDMSYYDPFFSPFATSLIYDNAFSFNAGYGSRWNRWNNYGSYSPFNSYGYGGYNSFAYDPWYRGNGYGSSYYGYNSYGAGYYCPPTWGNNYGYNTPRDIATNSFYGPRTSGTTRTPQSNDREIRREGPKDVTNTPRQGQGILIPQDRTPSGTVTPRDNSATMPSTRARAQEERRRSTETTTTPRIRNTRESEQPRTRTYEPPRESNQDRQRSNDWNNGNTRSNDSGTRSSSGNNSSSPRSSSSSSRRGNN